MEEKRETWLVFCSNQGRKVETASTFFRREKILAKCQLSRMHLCKRLFLRNFSHFAEIFLSGNAASLFGDN